jgi:hypothetical protein
MLHLLGRLGQGKIPSQIYKAQNRPMRAASRPAQTGAQAGVRLRYSANAAHKKTARACALAVFEHAAEAALRQI